MTVSMCKQLFFYFGNQGALLLFLVLFWEKFIHAKYVVELTGYE